MWPQSTQANAGASQRLGGLLLCNRQEMKMGKSQTGHAICYCHDQFENHELHCLRRWSNLVWMYSISKWNKQCNTTPHSWYSIFERTMALLAGQTKMLQTSIDQLQLQAGTSWWTVLSRGVGKMLLAHPAPAPCSCLTRGDRSKYYLLSSESTETSLP